MFLSLFPLAHIDGQVWLLLSSLSVPFSVLELACVCGSIWKCQSAFSVLQIVLPLTIINGSVCMLQATVAIKFPIDPGAGYFSAVLTDSFAEWDFDTLVPLALVDDTLIVESFFSFSVFFIILPHALVD